MTHPQDLRVRAIDDRLDRTDEHMEVIKGLLRDYFNSDAYQFIGKYDFVAGRAPIRGGAEMPAVRLATVTGEVLHDLRSALDHLAWELVRANGGEPTPDTRFPLCKAPPTPNKQGVQPHAFVAGGVSDAAHTLIDAAQPYAYGADYSIHPLWFLQRMSIVDKHRHIAIHGVVLTNISFQGNPFHEEWAWTAERLSVSEHGAELRFVPDDPGVDMEGGALLQIVVDEPAHGIEYRALLGALEDALGDTRRIVAEAKTTCF